MDLNSIFNRFKKNKEEAGINARLASIISSIDCSHMNQGANSEHKKVIWQLWWQGKENAPELIKKSLKSVAVHCSDYKQIILDKDTISDYIQVPEHIIKKHEDGCISHTHFSDILRLLLLSEYGGIWADATTYFSEPIPKDIQDLDFFVFQDPTFPETKISSWFIKSLAQYPLLNAWKESLLKYWEIYDDLVDYFLVHHAFAQLVEHHTECMQLFKKVPFKSNQPPHYLQFYLNREANVDNAKKLLTASFIHKLTYKNSLNNIDSVL